MKRALLCVCPPYPMVSPPAGAAALLGYLKAHSITDFGFLDLRLGTPSCVSMKSIRRRLEKLLRFGIIAVL